MHPLVQRLYAIDLRKFIRHPAVRVAAQIALAAILYRMRLLPRPLRSLAHHAVYLAMTIETIVGNEEYIVKELARFDEELVLAAVESPEHKTLIDFVLVVSQRLQEMLKG